MQNNNIKILTQNANILNDEDWSKIEKLIINFPSNVNLLHNIQYLKNKLLKSPYGSCYVTRVFDEKGLCVGFLSLTRKSFKCLNKKFVSFELGDAYLQKNFQGKFIFVKMVKDILSYLKIL